MSLTTMTPKSVVLKFMVSTCHVFPHLWPPYFMTLPVTESISHSLFLKHMHPTYHISHTCGHQMSCPTKSWSTHSRSCRSWFLHFMSPTAKTPTVHATDTLDTRTPCHYVTNTHGILHCRIPSVSWPSLGDSRPLVFFRSLCLQRSVPSGDLCSIFFYILYIPCALVLHVLSCSLTSLKLELLSVSISWKTFVQLKIHSFHPNYMELHFTRRHISPLCVQCPLPPLAILMPLTSRDLPWTPVLSVLQNTTTIFIYAGLPSSPYTFYCPFCLPDTPLVCF